MERMKREIPKHCNDLDRIRALENDNERLEEENKKLKIENVKLKDRIITDENFEEKLDKENKKLRAELEECECSFGFESDEVGYRKREYKRLKKWIKDHCKGYGNLFPEDEMKRQWKKADKKKKVIRFILLFTDGSYTHNRDSSNDELWRMICICKSR